MPKYDQLVTRAAERLLEDERLRSNLKDDEAKVLFDWAINWLTGRVNAAKTSAAAKQAADQEFARVRQVIAAIDGLAKKQGPLRLSEAVAAVEPILGANNLPRSELIALVTALVRMTWEARAKDVKPGS